MVNWLTAAVNLGKNESTNDSCTKIILSAVQRCPLKDNEPATASLTAVSISASGKIIAGFLHLAPIHFLSGVV